MTRTGPRLVLAALSLAATIGGWGTLAAQDDRAAPGGALVAAAAAPPLPTLIAPPAGRVPGGSIPSVAASASNAASAPRPIARTRSSR